MSTSKTQQSHHAQAQTVEVDDFNVLLAKEFKPRSDQTRAAVEGAVKTLADRHSSMQSRYPMMLISALHLSLRKLTGSSLSKLTSFYTMQSSSRLKAPGVVCITW